MWQNESLEISVFLDSVHLTKYSDWLMNSSKIVDKRQQTIVF